MPFKKLHLILGITFLFQFIFNPDLLAYSVAESKIFAVGPYAFKLEIQISGKGNLKKSSSLPVSSLKIKIKNDRASSQALKVKAIRIFQEPMVYQDVETKAFVVPPGKWTTKYFRLSRRSNHSITPQGFISIEFDNFSVRFRLWERKFQGPNNGGL